MSEKKQKDAADKKDTAEVFSDTTAGDGAEETARQESAAGEKVSAAESEMEEPVDSLEDLKQQLETMSDRYVRLMAEFDNFKKRVSRDYERLGESANEKLMIDLIDVRENFERALRSGECGADFQSLFEGMKLIFSKFDTALAKHGLEPFAQKGDAFDPQIHDALMKAPHQEIPEDHIADIYEKGYYLKGTVIKHARVIVSGGKAPDQES